MEWYVRLSNTRQEQQITQSDLANKIGIQTCSYSNYECGRREPSLAVLIKLSNALHTSIDYLLTGSSQKYNGAEENLVSIYRELSPKSKGRAIGYIERLNEEEQPKNEDKEA